MTPNDMPLGRRTPTDWQHVDKYPFMAPQIEINPRHKLELLFHLIPWYDQGREGACVGFAGSWMMSTINRKRYDPRWLWDRSKERDEWSDTNPGDDNGTSVRAAMDVLRSLGHVRVFNGQSFQPTQSEGIRENRWVRSVEDFRLAIASGVGVQVGVNWYSNFDTPQAMAGDAWVGVNPNLGRIRGGHSVFFYEYDDEKQAARFVNSWGYGYPRPWMPYNVIQRLLDEYGEATLVTDW